MKFPEQLNFIENGKKKQKETITRLDGLLAVISGSTSGVGKATAFRLAEAGCNIILVARNQQKVIEVQNEIQNRYPVKVDFVIADFSDFDSVKKASNYIKEHYSVIDILINSVGIHSTTRQYGKQGYDLVMTTNHLSVLLFTIELLPSILRANQGRIIQVNSEGHRFAKADLENINFKRKLYTGLKSYGASKTAQLYTVYYLAQKLKNTSVTINAVHPGAVKTNIGQNNGFFYKLFFKLFTVHFLKDVSISANAIYYLVAEPREKESGIFFNLTYPELPAKHARIPELENKIMKQSCNLININMEDIQYEKL